MILFSDYDENSQEQEDLEKSMRLFSDSEKIVNTGPFKDDGDPNFFGRD
jgi:hypothetical protein